MALTGQITKYCERCGTELLSADPAPLCATCWLTEGATMSVPTVDSINGVRMRRVATRPDARYSPRHTQLHNEVKRPSHPRRRLAVAATLSVLSVFIMTASVPSTFAASTPATSLYAGEVKLDKGADACIGMLWKLVAAKSEGLPTPSAIVCPASAKPYIYTQLKGVTTISCPDPSRHGATSISVRSDTKVPVAR